MDIPLDEKVLNQLLRYNISIPVEYLIITNGSYVYGYERRDNGITIINELPEVTSIH
jgi:predicted type IV restriction endonuclease